MLKWTSRHAQALGVGRDDPRFQAAWAAFALLLALATWSSTIATSDGIMLHIYGYAQCVLQAVPNHLAKCPLLNFIIAEMQLVFALLGLQLEAVHWWSQENCLADLLSRTQTSCEPEGWLREITRVHIPEIEWRLLGNDL